jgi:hypothetical protein
MPPFNPLLYEPLARRHFQMVRVFPQGKPDNAADGVHLDGGAEGTCWATNAEVLVPPISPLLWPGNGGISVLEHTHWSPTNVTTVGGITALIQGLILPAALEQAAVLLASGCYAVPTLLDVESAGLEGTEAVGHLTLVPTVPDAPVVKLTVRVTLPPEVNAQIDALIEAFMLPALRAELGIR